MHFNHKLINDLSWSIGSPCLLDNLEGNTDSQHPYILTSDWANDQLESAAQLLEIEDRNPNKIQAFLSANDNFRLGYYFENLVAYWFSIHPDYKILEKNKVIQCDKEDRTLGEIDFIIHNSKTHQIIHLEVAVKFYLQVEHNKNSYWFGTNLKDRLDIKLQRLINHQIAMSDRLEQYTINKKQILLKGRLFKYSPSLCYDNNWLTLTDFLQLEDAVSYWIILPKPFWLSTLYEPLTHFLASDLLSKQQLNEALESLDSHPVCVAQIQNNHEIKRFFITDDNWKEKAIKTLL